MTKKARPPVDSALPVDPVQVDDDELTYALVTTEDVLEKISKAKRQWERTFDAIVDPLSIVDDGYRVLRANLAFGAQSGLPIKNIPGKRCHEVLFGSNDPCPACPLPHTLKTARIGNAELQRESDGHFFKVWTFPYDEGAQGLAVCHYQDATEEKSLARQLLQNEKMAAVGQLAGGVAHEINNPLGGILAFSQILRRELPKDDSRLEYVENIEKSALRCKKIVESLLNFSRAPNPGEHRPVSLNKVVEDSLFLVQHQYVKKQVQLKTELDPQVPTLLGNANGLEQVLLNLLTNALAATEKGGSVTVRSGLQKNHWAFLNVKDTGCGIEPKFLEKIFEPFFTTKPVGEGTGLGLAVSYRIVAEHGGQLLVKSQPGKGTEFEVLLPLQASANLRQKEKKV